MNNRTGVEEGGVRDEKDRISSKREDGLTRSSIKKEGIGSGRKRTAGKGEEKSENVRDFDSATTSATGYPFADAARQLSTAKSC